MNGVFKLENFDVRPENPQFPQHTGISLQVVMNENSVIEEWSSEGFPGIPFRFVAISEVTDGKIDVNARVGMLQQVIIATRILNRKYLLYLIHMLKIFWESSLRILAWSRLEMEKTSATSALPTCK